MIILKTPVHLDSKTVEHGWGIVLEELNITLYKLGINLTVESKAYLQTTKSVEGYYPNLSALIRGMVSKEVMLQDVETLKELDSKLDVFCKGVWGQVNFLRNQIELEKEDYL